MAEKDKEFVYPVGEEKLIIHPFELEDEYLYNQDDQEISDEEMAYFEALFEERSESPENLASGVELTVKSMAHFLTSQEQQCKREELKQLFKSVKASLEIEGLTVTEEMEELIIAKACGKMTHEEFLEKAKESLK